MRIVVLGDPVSHSRSPAIHNAALRASGLVGSYTARRVDASGFADAIAELRSGELDGANVTMPHKAAAAAAADRASPAVVRSGSANTLAGRAGEIWGENTDVGGLQTTALEAGMPSDTPVLVLGAGGAAAAALLAFEGRRLRVSARHPESAAALVKRVGVEAAIVAWGEPVPGAVLANATPLGMGGERLPPGLLEEAAGLIDMAYGAAPTPAVVAAGERGLPVADGLDLLVAQAALSFTWWTGIPAPLAVMRAAARIS